MRLLQFTTSFLASISIIEAFSIPSPGDVQALAIRNAESIPEYLQSYAVELEKRKGGGGKGGGGGGGGGSKSGGGGGSTSSGKTSSSSSGGGQTKSGSGSTPSYGGGRYYGGGAAVPYAAGQRSIRGILPFFLIGGALAFFPGLWLYGAYIYPYTHPYTFLNQSAANSSFPNGVNQTLPIKCLCAAYQTCGCDDNDDQSYYASLLGNGSYNALNTSLVRVTDVNGTRTMAINGTLANGTTAPGGTDDAAVRNLGVGYMGLWALAAAVGAAIMTL